MTVSGACQRHTTLTPSSYRVNCPLALPEVMPPGQPHPKSDGSTAGTCPAAGRRKCNFLPSRDALKWAANPSSATRFKMPRDLPITSDNQLDMFSVAGRYGVVGTGAARQYFDKTQPDGCVAQVTSAHEHVHEMTLNILNSNAGRGTPKASSSRFVAAGSGCSARIHPAKNVNDTVLQISTRVGGQDFFDALIERILNSLDAHLIGETVGIEAYTRGPWVVGIGPPEHQASCGSALDTRITHAGGGIIATFEVGRYAPGSAEESAANARRAAVCVTKLQGVSTELLGQLPDDILCYLIESYLSTRKAA